MNEPPPPQPTARRQPQRGALLILSACTLLGASIGVLLARIDAAKRPLYETSAQLRLSQPAQGSDSPTPPASLSDEVAQTQALLIKSTNVVQRAVEEYRLHELSSFQHVQQHNVPLHIAERLTTRVLPDSGKPGEAVVEVTYRGPNVVDAITTVQAVARAYQDSLSDPAATVAGDRLQQLGQSRDELEAELKKQREELRNLHRNTPSGILTDEDDPNHPAQQLRRYQQERDAANRRRAGLQVLLTTAQEAQQKGTSPAVIGRMLRRDERLPKPAPSADSVPSPTSSPPASLSQPDLKIDDEKSLAELFQRLRTELEGTTNTLKELDETVRRADLEFKYQRDFQVQRRLLEDEIKSTDSLLQALLERMQKMEHGEASSKLSVEIVAPPHEAREVSSPLLTAEVGTGAVLGLLLGVIGAAFYIAFVPAGT